MLLGGGLAHLARHLGLQHPAEDGGHLWQQAGQVDSRWLDAIANTAKAIGGPEMHYHFIASSNSPCKKNAESEKLDGNSFDI